MILWPGSTRWAAAPLTCIVPRAGLAVDHVGDEAGAVVDVPDVDLLVGDQVGLGHQLGVDRDAADVVDVAVGDRRAVDLGLQHLPLHWRLPLPCRFWLVQRSDQDVVDQSRAADPGGDGDQDRAAVQLGDRLERLGVAGLQVLGLDRRRRRARGGRPRGRRRASPRGRSRSAAARARESATARSRSRGVEVGVARAHRQAVGLAHGRQHLDPQREVEVADHAPDHRRLLGVLLAEVGDVGADDVEELGDDGGDAAEVLGAAARGVAVEHLGQAAADLDRGGEALGVDLARPAGA